MEKIKILILGSWHEEKVKDFLKEAEELGKLIFERGHVPVVAPGGGIYGAVGEFYRNAGGKESIGYYPSEDARAEVGEVYRFEPDKKIMVEEDYPTRNLRQVQGSDAVVAITGGSGAVTDFIIAVEDYKLPGAYLKGSSKDIELILGLKDLKGNPKVFSGDTVEELLDFIEKNSKNN